MPRYGSNPASGLDPRICVVCGSSYQPYRKSQITCGIKCYKRQPEVVAKVREHHAQPHIVERKNIARRVSTNPARREVNLRSAIRRYGITYDEYLAMLESQGDRCAICGCMPDPNGIKAASRLHVDHDHLTGSVRQLLCGRCNQGVGCFVDDPTRLRLAAEYIERHRKE